VDYASRVGAVRVPVYPVAGKIYKVDPVKLRAIFSAISQELRGGD